MRTSEPNETLESRLTLGKEALAMRVERPDLCLPEPPDLPCEQVEAFALDGQYNGGASVSGSFRGAGIVAQVTVDGVFAKKMLALLHNPKCYGGEPMRCFIPRHGLRFSSATAQAEVLFCFECYWIYFFYGSKRVVASLNDGSRKAFECLFDEAFKKA